MKTDLKDKNGKEIKVGDILRVHWKEATGHEYDDEEVVILEKGGLYMRRIVDEYERYLDLINSWQIEGNVEILRGKERQKYVKQFQVNST